MKVLIWIVCIIGASIVQVLLKEVGIGGAIPAMLVYGGMYGTARALCKKHEERKTQKAAVKLVHSNVNNAPHTHEDADPAHPPIAFCRKCGNKLIEDSDFCSYCGTAVIKEENYELS